MPATATRVWTTSTPTAQDTARLTVARIAAAARVQRDRESLKRRLGPLWCDICKGECRDGE